MIPKGKGCHGCPAEHRGAYMCPDDNKPTAKVRIVAQNPGESEINGRKFVRWYKGEEGTGEIWEEDIPRPLIGKSGYELDHKFLPLAGLTRDDVECCNVVRCRLGNSNDLPPLTTNTAKEMVTHCQRAYWKEPHEGQALVALGAYALWALTGEYEGDDDDADTADDDLRASKSIDGWRGWLLDYNPQHRMDRSLVGGRGLFPLEQGQTLSSHRGKYNGPGDGAEGDKDNGRDPSRAEVQRARSEDDTSSMRERSERHRLDDDDISNDGLAAQGADQVRAREVADNLDTEELRGQRVVVRDRRDQAPTAGVKVFCTYHPAFFWRAHWLRPVGKMDWAKLGRYLRGTWPEPFPEINKYDYESHAFAFDTEYNPWTKELHRYSVAWRYAIDDEPIVRVVEARDIGIWRTPAETVIMQNAEADWAYMKAIFPIDEPNFVWHDTMLAHSLLYGTLRHSLDFMGSCYARHNRWKHLQQTDPLTYSGMDALATYDIWQSLARELARDRDSLALYEHELKPLLPHVMARPSIRLNALHIAEASQTLMKDQQELELRGQAAAGWPINISSADQVSRWLRLKRDAS